ncbi:MAG: type II toxin-antitoxin system RelE/ParE family toxin [Bacteroides sp.]|nr:type II toxin-antitoxin system RelE/ParE family toxin [Bacteroides sp.]
MGKLIFTNKAVEDLTSIWNYTANTWSERQADEYYKMLISSCRQITTNPTLVGKRYKEVDNTLYGLKSGKHIIFYDITSNGDIQVVRILHERMDLKRRIRE